MATIQGYVLARSIQAAARVGLVVLMLVGLVALPPAAQAFSFNDLEKLEKDEGREKKVRDARREAQRQEAARQEEARRQAQQEEDARQAQRQSASSGGGGSSGSSNSEVKWVITGQKPGGGLAHWYTMEYYVKCTSGRKAGESLTINHLKSSGKFQEVYGPAVSTFAESARFGCS